MDYIKLSDLVGQTFTIEKVWGFKWKMWDQEAKRMISEDTYFKGGRKIYSVDTDKGKIDLGQGQMGTILEVVSQKGVADINGKTIKVTSNGKTGMEIRYFFNEIKEAPVGTEPPEFLAW